LGPADGVRLGEGGDHHERQPLAVAAAVVVGAEVHRGCGADRGVLRRVVRAVDDGRGNVVVPAVRVVVGDDDRGRVPVLGVLDRVDLVDDERLLVEWVGVAGVAVLVRRCLEVRHRGQGRAAGAVQRLVEVRPVVFVVGLVGVADLRRGGRREVVRVRGGRVVLERDVVRRVVRHRGAADVLVRATADRATAVGRGRREAALEPAPGDMLCVQQVTDVLAAHHAERAGGGVAAVRAGVEVRVDVTVHRAVADGARRGRLVRVGRPGRGAGGCAGGVTGHHVECTRGGRAEGGVPVVVAHRVVLRVVPQRRRGVAVVVVHDDAGRAGLDATAGGGRRRLGVLDEQVHFAAVNGLLLRRVTVVLVRGKRLRVGQPLRVVLVRVAGEQRTDRAALGDLGVEAVDGRGARLGGE